jgi:hypothetical protein
VALCAGTYQAGIITDGAQVLELDIALERTKIKDALGRRQFETWDAKSVLPSATGSALRELLEHPTTNEEYLMIAINVIETLIKSLLALKAA